MYKKSSFISKTNMRKVNAALRRAGYTGYVGDATTAHPNGGGSGYVMNLLSALEPNDLAAQESILDIINEALV